MERERERERAQQCHTESVRKGAAFLSNVIETTIKYERTTMNAPNNPELFAGSIPRSENEGIASTLPFEGCEDMIKLRDVCMCVYIYRLFVPCPSGLCDQPSYISTKLALVIIINVSIRILFYFIFFANLYRYSIR